MPSIATLARRILYGYVLTLFIGFLSLIVFLWATVGTGWFPDPERRHPGGICCRALAGIGHIRLGTPVYIQGNFDKDGSRLGGLCIVVDRFGWTRKDELIY